MTRKRFHGLKKVKVRPTWSKWNLYNLSRLKPQTSRLQMGTFFQQKWAAKSITRAYHGEHIREKQWQHMFSTRLHAVVPMNHKYLAEHDGSELAAGRGSGQDKPATGYFGLFKRNQGIPFMHMTYAPMERRLDMAVWRALFASSARQARQFVIHGMVKVNGTKMQYPGYLLNPGDMFQVEVDRVLYATGAPKNIRQVRAGRKLLKAQSREKKGPAPPKLRPLAKPASITPAAGLIRTQADIQDVRKQRKLDFKELLTQVQDVLADKRRRVGAKRKIAIRAFARDVRRAMSSINRKNEKELDDELAGLISKLAIAKQITTDAAAPAEGESSAAPPAPTPEEQKALREAITRARENPIDESKPYATPWRPRPYMPAFAFIPRYLEVNHNICSAVYLRHPVARRGQAEVPSPFGDVYQQLAFGWYLRRR